VRFAEAFQWAVLKVDPDVTLELRLLCGTPSDTVIGYYDVGWEELGCEKMKMRRHSTRPSSLAVVFDKDGHFIVAMGWDSASYGQAILITLHAWLDRRVYL
jgi:hypothetical protein